MVDINIDADLLIESGGPVYYNGHWITYGVTFTDWGMRCSACGKSVDGPGFGEIDERHLPVLWMYHLEEFGESCVKAYDTFDEVIKGEILDRHSGKIATPDRKSAIRTDIKSQIFVGSVDNVNLSVDFR